MNSLTYTATSLSFSVGSNSHLMWHSRVYDNATLPKSLIFDSEHCILVKISVRFLEFFDRNTWEIEILYLCNPCFFSSRLPNLFQNNPILLDLLVGVELIIELFLEFAFFGQSPVSFILSLQFHKIRVGSQYLFLCIPTFLAFGRVAVCGSWRVIYTKPAPCFVDFAPRTNTTIESDFCFELSAFWLYCLLKR